MAKPFKLQTVLNYRHRLENIASQKLADALYRERALQPQLAEKREDLHRLQKELTRHQQIGISVQQLQFYRHSIHHAQTNLRALEKQIVKLCQEVEARRRELVVACRDKKLLENLKEKMASEEAFETNRIEDAQLDEIALRIGMTKS